MAVTLVGLWVMQSAFNIAPLHTSLPGITAAEPVAGIVLGMILVARSPGTLAAAQIPPIPGFELHPARKMAATGSRRIRRRRGVGHGRG
jgi:hypothetical protein